MLSELCGYQIRSSTSSLKEVHHRVASHCGVYFYSMLDSTHVFPCAESGRPCCPPHFCLTGRLVTYSPSLKICRLIFTSLLSSRWAPARVAIYDGLPSLALVYLLHNVIYARTVKDYVLLTRPVPAPIRNEQIFLYSRVAF